MTDSGGLRRRGAGSPHRSTITFVADGPGYRGTGIGGRSWCITRALTGWRLEFRDPGDDELTYAGIFGSMERAVQEASGAQPGPRLKDG